ncbi:DUF4350 domain-containing protein [Nocardiopsis tropica]|uniref:DUF4350 domain-containing protein n=1 Tax=Nocardiopsis tropica TaxID=109330 RepID=A0ABU7KRC5_9ACTN|nr:DUF4350 domain-containing protein [Nocardiopsis umidischolae]MEE2051849.1 DUF4350 domain-containing protein [Nocardiopsis umidischolae]
MTATAPAAPPRTGAPRDGGPDAPRALRLWRSARTPVAVVTALVVVSVLLSLGTERFPTGYLEPGSVSPDGTRALVEVLGEDRDVGVVRSSAAAGEAVARAGGDAVLVVTLDHRLLPSELEELAALDTDTVLVQPSVASLAAFAPGVEVTGREVPDNILEYGFAPECGLPAAEAAGNATVGGELYTAPAGADATGCYPGGSGDALLRVEDGGTATTVLGTGTPLTNTALDTGGNAALAMNLMAADDVVWLRPDPPRQEGSATLWELVPPGLRWSLVPLAATLLLLALWRGRRMGALVPEALPVVVRASETTEGRAGLYQARKARDRAAYALRSGFLERTVPKLGLSAETAPEAVVETVAARTGDDPGHLRALLYPDGHDPYAADDDALVRLADELDERTRRLR